MRTKDDHLEALCTDDSSQEIENSKENSAEIAQSSFLLTVRARPDSYLFDIWFCAVIVCFWFAVMDTESPLLSEEEKDEISIPIQGSPTLTSTPAKSGQKRPRSISYKSEEPPKKWPRILRSSVDSDIEKGITMDRRNNIENILSAPCPINIVDPNTVACLHRKGAQSAVRSILGLLLSPIFVLSLLSFGFVLTYPGLLDELQDEYLIIAHPLYNALQSLDSFLGSWTIFYQKFSKVLSTVVYDVLIDS